MHKLITLLRSEEFSPGHRVVRQGKLMKYVYFINRGKVMISHEDNQGMEYDVVRLTEGSFYGEY